MKRGVSIIEILIVVAIIAFLAAIVIPSVLSTKNKDPNFGSGIYEYTIHEHIYLKFSGGGLIHAEHCPCKQKDK